MLVNILFYMYLQVYKRLLQKIFDHIFFLLCAALKSHMALEKSKFSKAVVPSLHILPFQVTDGLSMSLGS